MFRRLPDPGGAPLRFTFDGRDLAGRAGDTVATALLANGILTCRTTPVSGAPRAPYCLMGICFECLVAIDGAASRQACLVPLAEGMRVEMQHGPPSPEGRAESATADRGGVSLPEQRTQRVDPTRLGPPAESALPSGEGDAA